MSLVHRHWRVGRRLTPVLLATVLVAAACGGPTASPPPDASGPTPVATPDAVSAAAVEALRAEPYVEANTQALIEALGRSGVTVVEDAAASEPPVPVEGAAVPLRFTRWQAHAMGLQAATGGGLTGAELDALIPVPEGMPRTSRIVAGYLARVDSPGARLGRALLGDRDWTAPDEIVIPSLVLATLSAEVTADAMAAGADRQTLIAAAQTGRLAARLAQSQVALGVGGVRGAVSSFVENTIQAVFDALKVESDGSTAGDIVAGIWNFLVEIGEAIVESVAEIVTAPVLAVIRAVAGAVAVVASIVSIIQPWALRVTGDPALTRFAVGNEPGLPGLFEAEVDVGGLDEWPADVAGCAAAAGVPLPPLGAEGAPVEWKTFGQLPGGLMSAGDADGTMPKDEPAGIETTTGSEPPEVAKGDEAVGLVRSDVTIKRPGISDLASRLQSLLFAQLPDIVAAALAPILGPIISSLVGDLAELQDVRGTGYVSVIYHVEPEETPPPAQAATDPPAQVGHPCDYVSTNDLNAIAEGNWSQSRNQGGAFQTCQFDDRGANLIPPSFAVISISTNYPSWDAIANGADSEAVGGLGDEAYMTGDGLVLFVRKGNVVINTSIADMIVEDADRGDFTVDMDADRQKAIDLARLVLSKLP